METTPQKIGKYDIVAPLGQGAMGVVYQAFDPMIRRYVALKTVNLGFAGSADDDTAARFHREAQAAGNLNHPNIVGIYEYGEEEGRAFIAMQFVEGRTLTEMLRQKHRFELDDIRRILSSVLAALDYSHRMGVIHRDIKPGNIMLDTTGVVKVMDFGIARIESSELTQAGTILGTPGYMSPEQLLGETVDQRSDIYSAGIVLYEMLTGERAFAGASFASVIHKVIHDDLAPPSRRRPALPGSFDALVARACAKKADARFDSAEAFAAALDEAFAAHGAGAATVPVPADGGRETGPAAARSTRRWFAVAAFLAAAVGLVLAGWYLLPLSRTADEATRFPPGTVIQDCATCPELVVLPTGRFVQGAPETESARQTNEGPMHLVSIDYPLAVGRYEITRRQYAAFAAETNHDGSGCYGYNGTWTLDAGRSWRSPGFDQTNEDPATCISWNDAQSYVAWLSTKTGHRYRLLSASEWEYAARADSASGRADGTDIDTACDAANVADSTSAATYPGWDVFQCRDGYVHTAPVGSYLANRFGLNDMIGNVFEWVADCWHDDYTGAPTDGGPWTEGACDRRVLRGGSWFTPPGYVRAAFRNRFDADYRSNSFGFRVARSP